MANSLSIIIPAKNEAPSLRTLLPVLKENYPDAEIIVVDDGSEDETAVVCKKLGVRVVAHPYCMGNGAAVKSGARAAMGEVFVFMDADGQHDPVDVRDILDALESGYDMVVGAREASSQASLGRWFGNAMYNRLASWIVGQKILDLTSGFRAVRARKFREFLNLLPNGFSYPTTITMAFFRAGYLLRYVPIHTQRRIGKSHLRIIRDGIRFVVIIFRVGTLYSPLKIFLPISAMFFGLGLFNYIYTFWIQGRFTNMSALLFVTSVLVFLIGLVSEQITNLVYMRAGEER